MNILSISKLKKSQELIGTYQQKISPLSSTSERQKQLIQEIIKRFKNVGFILEEIQKLQTQLLLHVEVDTALLKLSEEGTLSQEEIRNFLERNPIENMVKKLKLWDQLTFFTESLYYQVFRCGKCIEILPGLESFKGKYRSISFVRNHLIEHPEVVLSTSIMLGGDTGPVLKNSRLEWEKEYPQDKGLNHNILEFLENFINLFS